MSLDVTQLGKDIFAAFNGTLIAKWPEIREYGEAEAKKLAQTLVMIETLKISGKITKEQAVLHLEIQKNATRMVFMTIEGLGILAAEAAITEALNVVRDSVNTAVGFSLL